MNERIHAREVRLIDENGEMLEVISPVRALEIAREREMVSHFHVESCMIISSIVAKLTIPVEDVKHVYQLMETASSSDSSAKRSGHD